MTDHTRPSALRLGVNIDHVATIRNARGGRHPDPLRAAHLAIEAGADGITAHLREDRRHISDADIEGLMAAQGDSLPETAAATLVRIRRNCEEMQDMIRDYLDLSRAERGELAVRPARIDLARDVVEPAVSLAQTLLLSRGIELEVRCRPGLLLDADPELLRILVGNLLSNAAKYGREGGRARVAAESDASGLRLEVWNEGPGFTAAERETLFRKFSRIRNAATRDKRGSGLGLFLCQEIARLHGGRVEAESEPGSWARFTLGLPAQSPR